MPDGDHIHGGLYGGYSSAYTHICTADDEDYQDKYVADKIAHALTYTVKKYDPSCFNLMQEVAVYFQELLTQPLFKNLYDWDEVQWKIELQIRQARIQSMGNPEGIERAGKACLQQVQDLRNSAYEGDIHLGIVRKFLDLTLRARFDEPAQLRQRQPDDKDNATIKRRFTSARPHMEQHLASIAVKLVHLGCNVNELRAPRRLAEKRRYEPNSEIKINLPAIDQG